MAKLWEVIKAFQEGTAVKAFRREKNSVKAVKEDQGIVFYDRNNEPCSSQSVNDYDLNVEWEIIESPAAKTNDYLMVVCKITDTDTNDFWSEHKILENSSLNYAVKKMKHDFRDKQVELLSAVASSYKGVVTVLAYEGGMVE